MQPPSLGLWILFLWIKGTVNGTEVMGIIGSDVQLRCHFPENELPVANAFKVFWQIKNEDKCVVNAYVPCNEIVNRCSQFSDRTRLSDQLMQGDFTLQIFNISHTDEDTYICYILKKINNKFKRIKSTSATLKVAANYSIPILTHLEKIGEKVTYTCNSSQGYPEPKVFWINLTDNSPLKGGQMELTREPSGTFSVSSTLIIKGATSGVKARCVIENERLHENLTIDEYSVVANNQINSTPSSEPAIHTVSGILVVVFLAVLIAICWLHKRKS